MFECDFLGRSNLYNAQTLASWFKKAKLFDWLVSCYNKDKKELQEWWKIQTQGISGGVKNLWIPYLALGPVVNNKLLSSEGYKHNGAELVG